MGNVNDKLAYIDGTKTAIKDAIVAKGVAVPSGTTFREYADKIGEIQGGGAGEGDYLVRFLDWEGTILKEQRVNSGLDATAPTLPTHTNLTFQEWNNAFTNVTRDIDVGATYGTTDGKTYLYIEVNAITGLSPILYLNKSTSYSLTVNWGNGETSTISADGDINLTKTYAIAGSYTITIECAGEYGFGNGGVVTPVFSSTNGHEGILRTALIGDNVTSIDDSAFQFCMALFSISVPLGVTSIGTYAFQYCYALSSISIPSGVTSIGTYAFNSCYALVSISIPSGVTSIGTYAFQSCSILPSISVPSSVTSIGNNTFQYCYALVSISIPSSVTSIGTYAFQNCRNLISITIPSSVTSIGSAAFQSSAVLDFIFNSVIPPTITSTDVFTPKSISKIYVPDDSVDAYKAATNWVTYANYIYPLSLKP